MYRPTKPLTSVPVTLAASTKSRLSRKIRHRFLPRLNLRNTVYLTGIFFVFWIALSDMFLSFKSEHTASHSSDERFHVPKVNAFLSDDFVKLRGKNLKDIGDITRDLKQSDRKHATLKTTTRNLLISIYKYPWDEVVSFSLVKYETWDADQIHDLESILNWNKQLGLIDIGAYIGVYTLVAASMGRKVLAVDACHGSISRLHESVHLNRFQDRVTLIEAAVSTSRGFSFIVVPLKNAAGAYPQPIPRQMISPSAMKHHKVVKNIFFDSLHKFAIMNSAVLRIDIGVKGPMILAKSRMFDIIDICCIFMSYTYEEKYRRYIQKALEDIAKKGFVPKRARMDVHPLDASDFENWPNRVLWMKQHS